MMCIVKPKSIAWEDCGDVATWWMRWLRLSTCVISENSVMQLQIKKLCAQCLRKWQTLLTLLKICQVSVTCIISADPVSPAQVTDKQSKSLYCWLAHTSHQSTASTPRRTRHFALDYIHFNKNSFHNIYYKFVISLYAHMRSFACFLFLFLSN